MESNSVASVQYDRVSLSLSLCCTYRIYNRVCNGRMGVVVKTAGALAALVFVYILGYLTGYYVHTCSG
uniref:Small integral membrane protein 1 n=1 Tax=Gasterosteus aculeatus aculeatus TaxID=481459 RepID=A0AAQ4QTW9_GASAC